MLVIKIQMKHFLADLVVKFRKEPIRKEIIATQPARPPPEGVEIRGILGISITKIRVTMDILAMRLTILTALVATRRPPQLRPTISTTTNR